MRHLAVNVLVLLGATSISSGQTEVLPRSSRHATSVAVLALPGSLGPISSTRETRHLADTIATALRSAGLSVLVAGVVDGVPLEELNATANTRLADVALGVWNVAGSTQCPAVLAPEPVARPEPESFTTPVDQTNLGRHFRQIVAASRSEASARFGQRFGICWHLV